jgi:hypothetical protein
MAADSGRNLLSDDYEDLDQEVNLSGGINLLADNNEAKSKGFSGIKQDIFSSAESFPAALWEMLKAFPGEFKASGQQILTNPKRAASNVAGGAVKGLRATTNVPHNIREYLLEKEIPLSSGNPYPKFEPSQFENWLLEGNEPGDPLLRGGGEFAIPFSRVGAGAKGLTGVAKRAGGVGLIGVGDEEVNPLHAMFMSLFGEGAAKAAKKGGQAAIKANPFASNKEVYIKGIEPGDVKDTVEAARRLNLTYVTPGEASGFGYIGSQEGKIGNTLEGSKLREKKAKERMLSEEAVIDDFLNRLDDKIELPKEKQALYESVLNQELPNEFMGRFIVDNPIVEAAMSEANRQPAYKQRLKGVSPTSFRYWDEIKRILYDMESAQKRKGKENLADAIGDVRKELIQTMDDIDPNYIKARKLGQRSILRREIEEGFDKKDMTGNNFYNNVIKSKSNFNKLYDDLSEFPDMQQQLLDMKLVFPKLFGQRNSKATTLGERTHVGTPRSDLAFLYKFLKQHFNEKGDVKAFEDLISQDWFERLRGNEAIAPKQGPATTLPPELLQKFVEYLTKSSVAMPQDELAREMMQKREER